jgi:hypothetical protein
MSRRSIAARLQRAQAELNTRKGPQMRLPLEGGGKLHVPVKEALSALAESFAALAAIEEGRPVPPPGRTLRALGRVRYREDASVLGRTLVGNARTVREHIEADR